MTRILIITSCTGEKAVTHEKALTLDDFARGGEHLAKRENELSKLRTRAADLYTGQQHVRLMRGIQGIQESANGSGSAPQVDLWVLSAGYGLVPGNRKLAPYECTFQGMKAKQLRQWADELGIPTAFRKVVAEKYDLAMILLGDAYLKTCDIDDSIRFGGPTLLFCGNSVAKRLPRIGNLRSVVLSNPEASRFSCGLVGLKGEVADRLLSRVADHRLDLKQLSDPAVDMLAALDDIDGMPSKTPATKKSGPRPSPSVDRVIEIPRTWSRGSHKTRLRYFIPEWDDLVDPDYDFEKDQHANGTSDWSNNVYAHQLYNAPNYDGLLVSRVVAEKSKKKKARINEFGVHRFLRVPREYPVMGDCGAFGYINEDEPPYTTEDVLDYYTRLDFDFGVSVDHLIVTGTEDKKQFRYDLTIENAADFLKAHRKAKLKWEPIGAVQGWDPQSYANAAKLYAKMGYRYIALGGLVRSQTRDILAVVEEVRSAIPAQMQLHLFGVARPNALRSLADLGVNSIDSASVLRQAWMRTKDSYLLEDEFYGAIRIPEAGKSFRAKRMQDHASLTDERIVELEQAALRSIRAFARNGCSLDNCLDALLEYDRLVTAERVDMAEIYRKTLEDRPWERCGCVICEKHGIEVVIFRGNNRNRRRGFHNTFVFYQALRRILAGEDVTFGRGKSDAAQKVLFPVGTGDEA